MGKNGGTRYLSYNKNDGTRIIECQKLKDVGYPLGHDETRFLFTLAV